jgi:hypothetical protein
MELLMIDYSAKYGVGNLIVETCSNYNGQKNEPYSLTVVLNDDRIHCDFEKAFCGFRVHQMEFSAYYSNRIPAIYEADELIWRSIGV